jgi:hypothetical protein
MATNSIKDTDMGYAALAKGLKQLTAVPVGLKVGVLESAGAEMVKIAAINENGGGNVPARPFLGNTWDKNRSAYEKRVSDICMNPEEDVAKKLEKLGADMVKDVKATIQAGVKPDNAPSTLRRKTGSTPLINRGGLLNSISYKVGKR